MRLLAISTSGSQTSVCAGDVDQELPSLVEFEQQIQAHGSQAATQIFGLIDLAMSRAGFSAFDVLAFDAGPGGFTGVRVGCGVAQGLGFATNVPVLPVSALTALAVSDSISTHRIVLVAIDARMNEVYYAAFESGGLDRSLNVLIEPAVGSAQTAIARFSRLLNAPKNDVVFRGNGFAATGVHADLASWATGLKLHESSYSSELQSTDVAKVAVQICRSVGNLPDLLRLYPASAAAPEYVRNSVALDKSEQAKLRLQRQDIVQRAQV
jgi:tRNA threonylcarbamoyladenosine biosynthesis protein TsaB